MTFNSLNSLSCASYSLSSLVFWLPETENSCSLRIDGPLVGFNASSSLESFSVLIPVEIYLLKSSDFVFALSFWRPLERNSMSYFNDFIFWQLKWIFPSKTHWLFRNFSSMTGNFSLLFLISFSTSSVFPERIYQVAFLSTKMLMLILSWL